MILGTPRKLFGGGAVKFGGIIMKRIGFVGILLSILAAATFAQTPAPPQTNLKVGDKAPDFTLNDTKGKPVKLSDFQGKKTVVLAFYVLAFTGG